MTKSNRFSLEEADQIIEGALRKFLQDKYKLFVIKVKPGLYFILSVEFYFPPALVSIESDPYDRNKASYAVVSLRIPVPCEFLPEALMLIRNVMIFEVEQLPIGSGDKKMCFLNVGLKIHITSIASDPNWFIYMLACVLRAPLNIYPRLQERTAEEFSRLEEARKEYDDSMIW
ncbi:MAG: hypothetical protein NDP13_04930 [Crenarchaeota archaeon]|nr:hypothetical protein [Thermoproteota archaeon]MCR8454311.1 hypothetical protein [Thermoproteota archaeon]MCR8455079.1 hypothetical protein [Thermoproteota archaeon]MCR8470819.1 hypothetical protein [Thermoproteota archaeon]MCR8472127.1 hypothetical protein [Thermoproteota archaeon]